MTSQTDQAGPPPLPLELPTPQPGEIRTTIRRQRHPWLLCCPLTIAACAAAAGCSGGPLPSISLPKEVRGRPGEFVQVTAETRGESVAWLSMDEDNLRVFPATLLRDSRTAHVVATRPGRYRLKAITTMHGQLSEWASCTVVIEEGSPAAPAAAAIPAKKAA